MTKAAAKRETTTTDPIEEEMQAFLDSQVAKTQFLSATASMGIRLAITVVVPIVAGVKLDEHFHSSPSLTLGGMFLAVAAGSAAVWSTIKDVTREQETEANNANKKEKHD